MTEFLDASYINDLIERMLPYIKAQTENPKFSESGFTRDKIMHLYINFHRLTLTRGGSYTELPKWIKSKKAMINHKTRMKSVLNGLSLQHYITKILKKTINAYRA